MGENVGTGSEGAVGHTTEDRRTRALDSGTEETSENGDKNVDSGSEVERIKDQGHTVVLGDGDAEAATLAKLKLAGV
jgi:hypothetical protein